jgi:hypothetical protein
VLHPRHHAPAEPEVYEPSYYVHDRLGNAGRYEHSDDRTDTRAGHYTRYLHVKAGVVRR